MLEKNNSSDYLLGFNTKQIIMQIKWVFFHYTLRNKRNMCSKMVDGDYSGIISLHCRRLKNL